MFGIFALISVVGLCRKLYFLSDEYLVKNVFPGCIMIIQKQEGNSGLCHSAFGKLVMDLKSIIRRVNKGEAELQPCSVILGISQNGEIDASFYLAK